MEADVVGQADVVEPGVGGVPQQGSAFGRVGDQDLLVQIDADGHGHAAATRPSSEVAMIRFWISAVPSAMR